jgi:hypothetical protein
MSNVLSEEKKQQVIALGRLGWPLRRNELRARVRSNRSGARRPTRGDGILATFCTSSPRAWTLPCQTPKMENATLLAIGKCFRTAPAAYLRDLHPPDATIRELC